MGCCVGLRPDTLMEEGIIVNIGPKEKEDLIQSHNELCEDKTKSSEKINNVKQGKISSKTVETNNTDKLSSPKSPKRGANLQDRKVRHTAKNLKKISISEVENIHKFFGVN